LKAKIPWPRILAEGLVIVVSILLAFWIDAWWDRQQEEARRTDLLSSLCSDFTTTASLLDDALARADVALAASAGFVEWTQGGVDLRGDSVRSLSRGVFVGITFEPSIANYEAAIASGAISRLRSGSLLAALNRFDQGMEGYRQHDDLSGEIFYWGPMHDLRLELGPTSEFLADSGLSTVRENRTLWAAAAAVEVVQRNIRGNLRQMRSAADEILAELATASDGARSCDIDVDGTPSN
jgi:hypothetical protein